MTGRTHDLAAFTALNLVVISNSLPSFSLATGLVSLVACFIGGLAPDLDQPTAKLWRDVPAGTFIGGLISPIMGRHRFISHSIVGLIIFGVLTKLLLLWMGSFVLVDMNLVWDAFIIGFASHLVADSLTHDGVPWLFPILIYFGFPPIKALRMQTGGLIEKYAVFPGLLILNGYLFYNHYQFYLILMKKIF